MFHWGDAATSAAREYGVLCLGLDPVWETIPDVFKRKAESRAGAITFYGSFLIDCLHDKVGFIKPQAAFFEAFGAPGVKALSHLIKEARARGLLVILDAKRGDIGSTARAYADAYLGRSGDSDFEVDCMTVNPFLGRDALEPFIEIGARNGKGIFVLVKTSNPDGGWLQDVKIGNGTIATRIAKYIAEQSEACLGLSGVSSIGAVVGATHPEDGTALRSIMPTSIFLAPGIGAQGATSEAVAGFYLAPRVGVIVPASRAITMPTSLDIGQDTYANLVIERVTELQRQLGGAGVSRS